MGLLLGGAAIEVVGNVAEEAASCILIKKMDFNMYFTLVFNVVRHCQRNASCLSTYHMLLCPSL